MADNYNSPLSTIAGTSLSGFPGLGGLIRGSDPQLEWENILSGLRLPPRVLALLRSLTPQLMSQYLTKQSQMADWQSMWERPEGQKSAADYTFGDYLGGLDISQLLRSTMSQFPNFQGPSVSRPTRQRAY